MPRLTTFKLGLAEMKKKRSITISTIGLARLAYIFPFFLLRFAMLEAMTLPRYGHVAFHQICTIHYTMITYLVVIDKIYFPSGCLESRLIFGLPSLRQISYESLYIVIAILSRSRYRPRFLNGRDDSSRLKRVLITFAQTAVAIVPIKID